MTTGHKDWHNNTKGTEIITRVEVADSLMTLDKNLSTHLCCSYWHKQQGSVCPDCKTQTQIPLYFLEGSEPRHEHSQKETMTLSSSTLQTDPCLIQTLFQYKLTDFFMEQSLTHTHT